MLPYRLTDLALEPPGFHRATHGLAARAPLRFARRVVQAGTEVASAAVLDRIAPLRTKILAVEDGDAAPTGGGLGLYLHWAPGGRVSDMVLGQLAAWRACGFDMVFVSNARPPAADWARVAAHAVLRIARANVGRDFGGWRDALRVVRERRGLPSELLLANDSVLGPLRPLGPVVEAWRAGGDGLFGLTESRGGAAHLQSYALLARGPTVALVADHLAGMRDSRSKWNLVYAGEIGLTQRALAAGHRCAALFGYDRVVDAVDDTTRAVLGPPYTDRAAMRRVPLNPTHHLWRFMVERLGFPFLKTELVRRNPGGIPGVDRWAELVPAADAATLRAHLHALG